MSDKNPFHRLVDALQNWVDQLLMIFNLATLDDSVETRLKRLRHIYYDHPKVNATYRSVKDVLRGHVDAEFYAHYDRLMTAERAAYQIVKNLPHGTHGSELLEQMQNLGEKVARLIDQIQNADQAAKLYTPESKEAKSVAEARSWLLQRVEQSLELHVSIPARLLTFSTATSGRGIDKIGERISRLSNQLDDIADSYAEISQYMPAHEREALEQEIEQAIRHLEQSDKEL